MADKLPQIKIIFRGLLKILVRIWLWRVAVPKMAELRKILVVRSDHLGDLILSLPAIAQIRKMYPTSIVDALVGPVGEELLHATHLTNHIHIIKVQQTLGWIVRFAQQLKKERYDLIIDVGSGNPARIALAAVIAKIPLRIGFDIGIRSALFSTAVSFPEGAFEGDLALAALAPIGYKQSNRIPNSLWKEIVPPERWRISGSMGIKTPYIVLCPFVDHLSLLKEWPIDRFIDVIRRLSEDPSFSEYFFVITGSRMDEKRATIIEHAFPRQIINLVGKTRVLDWLNLMDRSKMVLTNNSGAMQISYLIDTPVIVINGPSSLKRWINSSIPGNLHLIYRDLDCTGDDCSFCRKARRDCLENISVDEVFEMIKKVITMGEVQTIKNQDNV